MNNCTIDFEMIQEPNKQRVLTDDDLPFSLSTANAKKVSDE
jgi:hypothetical protein